MAFAGGDEVLLKDGTVLRGTVVKQLPGKVVVIKTTSGTTESVPWDDVKRVSLAEEPAAPAVTSQPNSAPPPTSEQQPPPPPSPASPPHVASITLSPIHLIFPVFEVTAEYAVSPRMGVALIGGYGSLPIKTSTTSSVGTVTTTEHIKIWELGGHFNYYVVGSFEHGMQLGAEVLYVGASSDASSSHTAVTAAGLALGPYAGYKIITRVGFTFEANLGFQYVTLQAHDDTSSAKQESVIPLLNLNVGWSFLRCVVGRVAARFSS